MLWSFGRPFVVKAPACPLCGWLLQSRRLISLLLTILLVYLALWHLWPLVAGHVGREWRRWVMMLLGLACLVPLIIFEVLVPPPFSITAYDDSVDYEFSDSDMACEFAALNADAAYINVDGTPLDLSETT